MPRGGWPTGCRSRTGEEAATLSPAWNRWVRTAATQASASNSVLAGTQRHRRGARDATGSARRAASAAGSAHDSSLSLQLVGNSFQVRIGVLEEAFQPANYK